MTTLSEGLSRTQHPLLAFHILILIGLAFYTCILVLDTELKSNIFDEKNYIQLLYSCEMDSMEIIPYILRRPGENSLKSNNCFHNLTSACISLT